MITNPTTQSKKLHQVGDSRSVWQFAACRVEGFPEAAYILPLRLDTRTRKGITNRTYRLCGVDVKAIQAQAPALPTCNRAGDLNAWKVFAV